MKELQVRHETVSRDSSRGIAYSALTKKDIESNLLLVNTTPLGMQATKGQCVDIPFQAISRKHLCYDLIYNPSETEFLKRCKNQGATVKNGLQMLELQADRSWEIWNS